MSKYMDSFFLPITPETPLTLCSISPRLALRLGKHLVQKYKARGDCEVDRGVCEVEDFCKVSVAHIRENAVRGVLVKVSLSPGQALQYGMLENTKSQGNLQEIVPASYASTKSHKQRFQCFLCSVDKREEEDLAGEQEDSAVDVIRFDYLLVHGAKELRRNIVNWLETCFDSTISKSTMLISPEQLSRIAQALTQSAVKNYGSLVMPRSLEIAEEEYKKDEKLPLAFVFTLPEAVQEAGLDQITLGLPETGLQILHMALEGEKTKEDCFLSILIDYFVEFSNIDLAGARLTKLVTPFLTLDAGGRIKFLDGRVVEEVIVELADISRSFGLDRS